MTLLAGVVSVVVPLLAAATSATARSGAVAPRMLVHARSLGAGSRLWVRRYNGPGSGVDKASAIAASPDGSAVFVTGASVGPNHNSDYATIAYDSVTGAKRWLARLNGAGDGDDTATALAVSPDGSRVFVTGYAVGASGHDEYATAGYDASTGTQLWVSTYAGASEDQAAAMTLSPDGSSVFVTGRAGDGSISDYATVAYDASTGAQRWASDYTNGSGYDNEARAIGVSADGSRVFVTGESSGSKAYDYATVAYGARTGKQRWVRRYSGKSADGDDVADGLAVSPDGSRVFVTGISYGGGESTTDYATVAYRASDGATVWAQRYRGLRGGSGDAAYAIAMSPDGSQVYVTGISAGRLTTVAYNTSTGGRVWATRVANSAAGDSLAVSPDGAEVVAAGRDIGASGYYDYLTVGYDALTGAKLWTQQYDGPGDHQDIATAVAYSPSTSAVYVTGYSDPAQSDLYDYATIAYSVPDPSWDARREVAQERGRRFPRAGALSEAKRRPSPAIPPNRPGSR